MKSYRISEEMIVVSKRTKVGSVIDIAEIIDNTIGSYKSIDRKEVDYETEFKVIGEDLLVIIKIIIGRKHRDPEKERELRKKEKEARNKRMISIITSNRA